MTETVDLATTPVNGAQEVAPFYVNLRDPSFNPQTPLATATATPPISLT